MINRLRYVFFFLSIELSLVVSCWNLTLDGFGELSK